MRLFFLFVRKYPLQTVFMLLSLLVAGLLEGFGLSMLLPLLSFAIPQQAGEQVTQTAMESSKLERLVTHLFAFLNLTPSIENILIVILITVLLKSAVIILSTAPNRLHRRSHCHRSETRAPAVHDSRQVGILSARTDGSS